MKTEYQQALAARLLAMGDDELILGHRNSEWCGHAPILEEDIAFANIALDEIGHAQVWYGLLADLQGENRDSYPDWLVYQRPLSEFRCAHLVELPKGDWAFTMLRQYLFDAYENVLLAHLRSSTHQLLADAAAKIYNEEIYHLRHTSAWVRRLGLGTDESRRRMQTALDGLWPYCSQLFAPAADALSPEIFPSTDSLRSGWEGIVIPHLTASGLTIPENAPSSAPTRAHHTEHLTPLLSDLQHLVQQFPDAHW